MGRALAILIAVIAPGPAGADPAEPPPQPASWRLMLSSLTVLRANPTGLETRARFGLQKRLYRSEAKLSENNFGFAGAFAKLNPAGAFLALGGELQPLSILNLRAAAEVQRYFGAFGVLQSFPSANAIYSDAALDDLAGTARGASALRVQLQPTLQVRAGPIALRAQLQLDYWDLALRAGDVAAYEPTLDTLLPDRGFTLSADTDALYVGRRRLAVGLRHSYVRPLYRGAHFTGAADQAAYDGANAHQRLGLIGAYTLRDAGPSRFNKPTLILIASWYLSHRFRAGAPEVLPAGGRSADYTSRAFPYLLAGFAFESDFLPARY